MTRVFSSLLASGRGNTGGRDAKIEMGWLGTRRAVATASRGCLRADGSSGSFVGVYRPTEDGNYTWQKVNQIIDGQLMPNLDEVTVIRK